MVAAPTDDHGRAGPRTALTRLGIGLAQGASLWLLTEAYDHKLFPQVQPWVFAAATLVCLYAPLIVIGGLGRIRPVTLAVWTAVAAILLAVFGWHDLDAGTWDGAWLPERRLPAAPVFVFAAIFVFVGHHLVGPADQARRPLAPYPVYFDWAWKDAVQLALSAFFVGVLWAALELGAELFKLIGIDALSVLVSKSWFGLPVTFVALAGAVQLTDVRVGLIQGVRTVGLVLLSWLLPVMTTIVVAFLAALPFTGLGPLFATRSGASSVLSAACVLIVMTSAAYQDGLTPVPALLRWSARAAGLALTPLTLIAGYALALRVGQYGLSPQRIGAIVCAVSVAGFAIGYAIAAIRPAPWMRPLELTNVVMARVVMLLIVLLLTPIADPARLAVDDQVGRLMSGKTAPAAFDYAFLRNQAGRYGADAIARLLALKGAARNLAIAAAARASDTSGPTAAPAPPPAPLSQPIAVYPAGAVVPKSFLDQVAAQQVAGRSGCINSAQPGCQVYVLDFLGRGSPQVAIVDLNDTGPSYRALEVFAPDASGAWTKSGDLVVSCADAIAALQAGRIVLTPSPRRDIQLANRTFAFLPNDTQGCPETGGKSPLPGYLSTGR
jgi:hypothetical protein